MITSTSLGIARTKLKQKRFLPLYGKKPAEHFSAIFILAGATLGHASTVCSEISTPANRTWFTSSIYLNGNATIGNIVTNRNNVNPYNVYYPGSVSWWYEGNRRIYRTTYYNVPTGRSAIAAARNNATGEYHDTNKWIYLGDPKRYLQPRQTGFQQSSPIQRAGLHGPPFFFAQMYFGLITRQQVAELGAWLIATFAENALNRETSNCAEGFGQAEVRIFGLAETGRFRRVFHTA